MAANIPSRPIPLHIARNWNGAQKKHSNVNAPPSIWEQPITGALSHRLAHITSDAIQELTRGKRKHKLKDFEKVLGEDPTIKAAIALKRLRAMGSLGIYTNANADRQNWIRNMISNLQNGTVEDVVGNATLAQYYGFWSAEIVWRTDVPGYRGQWIVSEIIPHNPATTGLAGNRNGVTHVIDKSSSPHRWIPINKCLLIVNNETGSNNPYGTPTAEAAMPYIKAKQALMSSWLVAGKNQATGLLIGYANSNSSVTMLDRSGNPLRRPDGSPMVISAVDSLGKKFDEIDNKNYIVTDKDNQVSYQVLSVDSGFFQTALMYIDEAILLSQDLPSLTFKGGTGMPLGTATPAIQQAMQIDQKIRVLVQQIKDQIVEKIVRRCLNFNFGVTSKDGWGDFSIDSASDPNISAMKAQTLMQAMMSQIIPTTDAAARNLLRELLGLPKQDDAEMVAETQRAAQLQAMQALIQQQAMQQQQGAEGGAEAQQNPQAQAQGGQGGDEANQPYP